MPMMLSGGTDYRKIAVNSNWSTHSNAWNDIKTTLGIDLRNGTYAKLFITLWDGDDDWACLKIQDGSSSGYYSTTGVSAEFGSAPSEGFAYVMGIEYQFEAGGGPPA